jgi:hypothetical protein
MEIQRKVDKITYSGKRAQFQAAITRQSFAQKIGTTNRRRNKSGLARAHRHYALGQTACELSTVWAVGDGGQNGGCLVSSVWF